MRVAGGDNAPIPPLPVESPPGNRATDIRQEKTPSMHAPESTSHTRNGLRRVLAALLLTLLPLTGFAEGTVGFRDDILPLFRNKPALGRFVLASFEIRGAAVGIRLSGAAIPGLSGARIGPYTVPVDWRDHGKPVPATLTIYTTQTFYDSHGRTLEGDLTQAVKVVEHVDSISVDPAR
ncbi:hypothetical protein BLA17378_01804 [Burkholderia aenigmatica]|uniref:Uncharacterized protein n=2 Tax=Burkholderiaceae TaxID=119060 RepID=A0ABY6XMS1_9BURK|nr:hypothetical protein BLA17378_01804 [Burkholderia aenigmatica]VWC82533.1 hypothetical protein BLA18628_01309 [Burkholderia aenigmatica]